MSRIVDLHPDDAAARLNLRRQLLNARHQQGLSQAGLARRIGVTKGAVATFETRGQVNATIGAAQRYARGCGHRLTLAVRGLPDVDDATVILYRRLATTSTDPGTADAYHRAAIIAELRAARIATGNPAHHYAPAMGCGETAVLQTEAGRDDPLVSTYQRYARALGGWLHLDLQSLTSLEGKVA